MTLRTAFTSAFLTLALVGCASDHSTGDVDGAATPAPDGDGVCCPVSDFTGCSPRDEPSGGWAASADECGTVTWADGCPVEYEIDERGCRVLVDAYPYCDDPCGVPPPDAGF